MRSVMGRGGQFILPPEETFRIRFIGPRDFRIRNIMKDRNADIEMAERYVYKTEADRNAFHCKYFSADWKDPSTMTWSSIWATSASKAPQRWSRPPSPYGRKAGIRSRPELVIHNRFDLCGCVSLRRVTLFPLHTPLQCNKLLCRRTRPPDCSGLSPCADPGPYPRAHLKGL